MVEGLTIFRDRFRGLDDCYVLIGGTACDLWMGERALDFRATKDLDMVLVVEALRPEFFQVFWQFVKDAGYEGFGGGQEPRNFYRFKKPAQAGVPWMIELFSRRALDLPADVHLSPVPAGEGAECGMESGHGEAEGGGARQILWNPYGVPMEQHASNTPAAG